MIIKDIIVNIWILCSFVILTANPVHGDCFGESCGDCLVSGIQCLWCKKLNFTESRCSIENDHVLNGCTGSDIVRHSSSSFEFVKNERLRDGNDVQQPIQIEPQEVTIKLVPNKPYKLDFKYKVAKNFPVDIYFLVDPSYTMRTLREQLANLTTDIANSIAQLTTDYRFGYGTSMDKVVTPFTHISPAYLQNPCPGDTATTCAPPHSFIHRLNLTSNVTAFKTAVETTKQTANRDRTEGMFDGVMQASVCTDAIGWRSNARRIMLYASDSDYHFAGDGKLAGIVRKHDMKCHLAPFGHHMKYTHDAILDYPSIGQIRQVLSDNNINIIFVIGGNKAKRYYETLKIPGSYTEEFQTESKNILSIIRTTYETLRGTVKFVNDPFQNIDIEYRTNCNGKVVYGPRDTCQNIDVNGGEEISFEALLTLKITKCPVDANERIQRGSIYPEGLADKLNLNIEFVCDCDCQSQPLAVDNATQCSFHGSFECGICNCNEGFTGQTCDCDISKTIEETCGQRINDVTVICGNVGECVCGQCVCPTGFSGKYCECNNNACGGYISNGQLCNGHGTCECGICKCDAGFNGTNCDCPISTETCKSSNTTLCSDRGECICGKCSCDRNYRGKFCQECPTCRGCETNKHCAACVGFQTGPLGSSECHSQCSHVKAVDILSLGNSTSLCTFRDDEGCQIDFTYRDTGDFNLAVEVQNSKTCPPGEPSAIILASSVSATVFGIGVFILVVWKVLTTLHDRKEYDRFRREIEEANRRIQDEQTSPLYEPNRSENPTYQHSENGEHTYNDLSGTGNEHIELPSVDVRPDNEMLCDNQETIPEQKGPRLTVMMNELLEFSMENDNTEGVSQQTSNSNLDSDLHDHNTQDDTKLGTISELETSTGNDSAENDVLGYEALSEDKMRNNPKSESEEHKGNNLKSKDESLVHKGHNPAYEDISDDGTLNNAPFDTSSHNIKGNNPAYEDITVDAKGDNPAFENISDNIKGNKLRYEDPWDIKAKNKRSNPTDGVINYAHIRVKVENDYDEVRAKNATQNADTDLSALNRNDNPAFEVDPSDEKEMEDQEQEKTHVYAKVMKSFK